MSRDDTTVKKTTNIEFDRRQFMLAAAAAGATLGSWVPPARAAVGGHLELMAWEGYTLDSELAAWRKANNVTVNAAIMSNQDDVTAKLVGANPVRLDLAEYSNGYNAIYQELNVLTALDMKQVPNWTEKDIFSAFYNGDMWQWDGKRWAVPWCWGLDTLVYNPKLTGFEVKSYEDLLRPELKGKLTFVDNPLTTWPMIARVTGYGSKFPNMTKDELADSFKRLQPYREQCRAFGASHGDVISLFASGEIAACFVVYTAVPLETAKQGVDTVAIIPKEGAAMWADAWFVPHTAKNVETAMTFINQALEPAAQASMAQSAVAGVVNRNAVPLLNEQTRALFDYTNLEDVFKSSPILGQPPRTSDQFATYDDWLQAWSEFRAGF